MLPRDYFAEDISIALLGNVVGPLSLIESTSLKEKFKKSVTDSFDEHGNDLETDTSITMRLTCNLLKIPYVNWRYSDIVQRTIDVYDTVVEAYEESSFV